MFPKVRTASIFLFIHVSLHEIIFDPDNEMERTCSRQSAQGHEKMNIFIRRITKKYRPDKHEYVFTEMLPVCFDFPGYYIDSKQSNSTGQALSGGLGEIYPAG
ncbi:MAG TPA: hypothetical protein DIC22_07165, partial [Chitinophagaceae bacterium]|nr:hypothetical protein [Chitinophagaceae bacterium]